MLTSDWLQAMVARRLQEFYKDYLNPQIQQDPLKALRDEYQQQQNALLAQQQQQSIPMEQLHAMESLNSGAPGDLATSAFNKPATSRMVSIFSPAYWNMLSDQFRQRVDAIRGIFGGQGGS